MQRLIKNIDRMFGKQAHRQMAATMLLIHHTIMRSFVVKSRTIFGGGLLTVGLASLMATLLIVQPTPEALAEDTPAASPAHQVVACYFHRTVRCPTCKKIGDYVEESVQAGFEAQIKQGSVKVTLVDFQDAKNKKLTAAYKITGPTLVILDIHDGKVKAWKPAPKVWSLVGKKSEFVRYVQREVQDYVEGEQTAAP
ncbi:MAG: nitrophenyl compound nitroreductase subunit ArsF family protein [Pirellulaceae bacterium]